MPTRSEEFFIKLNVTGGRNLASELNRVNQELKSTNDLLKKTDPNSKGYSKLVAQQKLLREDAKKTNKAIRDQAKEFDLVERSIPKDSLAALAIEQRKLTTRWNELSAAQRKNSKEGKTIRTNLKRINDTLREQSVAVGNYRANVGNYARSFASLGRRFLAGFGIIGGIQAVAQVFKQSVKTIVDFDDSLIKLSAIMQVTYEDMGELKTQAQDLGAVTAFTASQVVELQTSLARLGFAESEIIASTEAIIDFTLATQATTADAARLAGAVLRSFNLDATEMTRVVSVLGVATTKSALDFSRLQTALPIVAATANAFGDSVEGVTAKLGVLSDRGLEASIAATALRNIYISSSEEGLTYEEALEKVRTATDKVSTAFQLFGKRGTTAALILAENTYQLNKLKEGITDVDSELEEMADVQLTSVRGKLILAKSAWEGFILSMADGSGTFSESLKGIIQGFTEFLNVLKAINDENITWEAFLSAAEDEPVIYALAQTMKFLGETTESIVDIWKQFGETFIGSQVAEYAERTATHLEVLAKIINPLLAVGGLFSTTIEAADIAAANAELEKQRQYLLEIGFEGTRAADKVVDSLVDVRKEVERLNGTEIDVLNEQIKLVDSGLKELLVNGLSPNAEGAVVLQNALDDLNRSLFLEEKKVQDTKSAWEQLQKELEDAEDLGYGIALLRKELGELQKILDRLNYRNIGEIESTIERMVQKEIDIKRYLNTFKDFTDYFNTLHGEVEPLPRVLVDLEENYKRLVVGATNKYGADPLGFKLAKQEVDEVLQFAKEFQKTINYTTTGKGFIVDFERLELQSLSADKALKKVQETLTKMGTDRPLFLGFDRVDDSTFNKELLELYESYESVLSPVGDFLSWDETQSENYKTNYEKLLKDIGKLNKEQRLRALEAEELDLTNNPELHFRGEANQEKLVADRIVEIKAEQYKLQNQLRAEYYAEGDTQREEDLRKEQEAADRRKEIIRDSITAFIDLFAGLAENQFESRQDLLDKQTEADIERLRGEYDARLALAEGNEALQSQLLLERTQREDEIREAAFEEQKKLQVQQAIVAGALALIQAFTAPFPLSIPLAATVAATTAIEIDRIKKTTYAEGGFTGDGYDYVDDTGQRVAGVVHENEYVAPTKQLSKYPDLFAWLERDRKKLFADGGYTTAPPPQIFSTFNTGGASTATLSTDQMGDFARMVATSTAERTAQEVGMSVYKATVAAIDSANRKVERERYLKDDNTY